MQLELALNLPACECPIYWNIHAEQRSIVFKAYCPQHRIYVQNPSFQTLMFYSDELLGDR